MRESPEKNPMTQSVRKSQTTWVVILSAFVVLIVILTSVLTWRLDTQKHQSVRAVARKNVLLSQQLQQLQTHISTWQNAPQSLQRVLTEARYWIRVAHLQLTMGQNDAAALQSLLLAQQTVDQNQNDVLLPLKQALSDNIQALQTVTPIHTNEIFSQFNAINQAVFQLSVLPNESGVAQKMQPSDSLVVSHWYDRFWHNIKNLKNLFVVEKLGKPTAILPSQDYWQMVKINFSMKVAIAEWALLHRHQAIYEESLQNMLTDLETLFPFSQLIAPIQDQIQQLKKINLNPMLPSLTNTLAILSRIQLNNTNTPAVLPVESTSIQNTNTKKSPAVSEKPTAPTFVET